MVRLYVLHYTFGPLTARSKSYVTYLAINGLTYFQAVYVADNALVRCC